ncbi:MAG: hypothetical protein PVI90_00860 [Desulfobacteraceae bacterium]|jgi:hypothetical protein
MFNEVTKMFKNVEEEMKKKQTIRKHAVRRDRHSLETGNDVFLKIDKELVRMNIYHKYSDIIVLSGDFVLIAEEGQENRVQIRGKIIETGDEVDVNEYKMKMIYANKTELILEILPNPLPLP